MKTVQSSRFGLGQTARAMELLGEKGVTPGDLQRIIDDPLLRGVVAVAFRGGQITGVSFEDLLEREVKMTSRICELAEIKVPDEDLIKKALSKAEKESGVLTEHDRFIPGGLGLPETFRAIYAFNKEQVSSGQTPLKLYSEPDKEWWRSDKKVQCFPTENGVIHCDFSRVMRATDIAGRPFYLDYDQQAIWAKEQSGDTITSAEETVCLFIRSLLEAGFPLWGAGVVRCRNFCSSSGSLGVGWDAVDGFHVGRWNRDDQLWHIGALARKFTAL